MLNFDFPRLAAIGLTPALLQQALAQAGDSDLQLAHVCRVQRDCAWVHDGEEERQAHALPGVHADLAVGDWAFASRGSMSRGACLSAWSHSTSWSASMTKARAKLTPATSTPPCW
ncbi:hypothetical protein [Chromobacterium violaceum]|uniref:hypothetical protein n=1 Tax=Chromobacterium violaceum TaxID=536 RepID=UPI001C3926AE|nr:hypothetical protein [Chromobacterium violaceum]